MILDDVMFTSCQLSKLAQYVENTTSYSDTYSFLQNLDKPLEASSQGHSFELHNEASFEALLKFSCLWDTNEK